MLHALQGESSFFDISRSFGIVAVILSIVMCVWSFFSACINWNKIQIILLCSLNFLGCIATGLTFLFYQSTLCTTSFETRQCQIGNGGLVMIGAILLWTVSFIISIVFVRPNCDTTLNNTNHMKNLSQEDKRAKAALMRQMARQQTKRNIMSRSQQQPNHHHNPHRSTTADALNTTPDTILHHNSYSFDSQDDWHKPIPSRSMIPPAFTSFIGRQQQQQQLQEQQQPQEVRLNQSYLQNNNTTASVANRTSTHVEPPGKFSRDILYGSNSGGGRDGVDNKAQSPGRKITPNAANVNMTRNKKPLIVDDVSEQDTMEVYIQQRLNGIDALITTPAEV
jgi:hypothetical protein